MMGRLQVWHLPNYHQLVGGARADNLHCGKAPISQQTHGSQDDLTSPSVWSKGTFKAWDGIRSTHNLQRQSDTGTHWPGSISICRKWVLGLCCQSLTAASPAFVGQDPDIFKICQNYLIPIMTVAGYLQCNVQYPQSTAHSGLVVCQLLQHKPMVGVYKSYLQIPDFSNWWQWHQVQDDSKGALA